MALSHVRPGPAHEGGCAASCTASGTACCTAGGRASGREPVAQPDVLQTADPPDLLWVEASLVRDVAVRRREVHLQVRERHLAAGLKDSIGERSNKSNFFSSFFFPRARV